MKNKRKHSTTPLWRKTVLATLAAAMTMPHGSAWAALDLAQTPPSIQVTPVAPNVLITLDDSGSMAWQLRNDKAGDRQQRPVNGKWPDLTPRMMILQDSLKKVFDPNSGIVPDGKIRLAWQAMHDNGNRTPMGKVDENLEKYIYSKKFNNGWGASSPKGSFTQIKPDQKNAMRLLDAEHRQNFLDFVEKLYPGDNTPTHHMMDNAIKYMSYSKKDKNNPWAAIPGKQAEPFLSCRRAYHILFTDGGWNDGNYNSYPKNAREYSMTSRSLPDGVNYDVASANTNIYRVPHANLSNRALEAWATDLQPLIKNEVPESDAYKQAPDFEEINHPSIRGQKIRIPKYWNPKYDPATWQHMVTYTIGFGGTAVGWATEASTMIAPRERVPFGYDGIGYSNLWAGVKPIDKGVDHDNTPWPKLKPYDGWGSNENKWHHHWFKYYLLSDLSGGLDLWSSAISGRGRFYAVEQAEDLEKAFRSILESIGSEPQPAPVNQVFSGSSAVRNDVGVFGTVFEPKLGWAGHVQGQRYKRRKKELEDIPGWEGKTTAQRLDERTDIGSRLILTTNDATGAGVPFLWKDDDSHMSTAQKTALGGESNGSALVNYIRGESSSTLRSRTSRHGDIVNSQLWYTGGAISDYSYKGYSAFVRKTRQRQPMLYVGANDGMLHGFSATNGKELLAYVPKGVIRNLPELGKTTYNENHRYFVDGSPMTGDVDTAGAAAAESKWRTMLVGTLGAGGRGYFVLDVTNPGTITPAQAQTNADPTPYPVGEEPGPAFTVDNAANLVVMDKTSNAADTPTTADDKDIGHIFAEPVTDELTRRRTTQIIRLNNKRWAVVMGNGYNSANERPVLLIQYLDGEKELKRIVATGDEGGDEANYEKGSTENTTNNGLSAPRIVDLNGDNTADVVYAGDLKGNVWKFDLTSSQDSRWNVAFGGRPLYTATDTKGKRQPISAPPIVRENNQNARGMMVAFGTGRSVTEADLSDKQQQTLYSVLDNTRYKQEKDANDNWNISIQPGDSSCRPQEDPKCIPVPTPVGSGVASLVQQTTGGDSAAIAGAKESKGRNFWSASDHRVDWNEKKGWYMHLPISGERLLKHMSFYEGTGILAVYTDVPGFGGTVTSSTFTESCEVATSSTRQFLTLLNITDGRRPRFQVFDQNGDGLFNPTTDNNVSRAELIAGRHTIVKKSDALNKAEAPDATGPNMNRPPEVALRPSWRQLR